MVPSGPPAPFFNEHPSGLRNIQSDESCTAFNESTRNSVTMAVDAATLRASQLSPTPTRSSSALHSLMEQGTPALPYILECYIHSIIGPGGQVELVLSNHKSHLLVPTRTIGDSSTGTQYELPLLSSEQSSREVPQRPPLPEQSSSDTARPRPDYLPLPSPRSFSIDDSSSASTYDKSSPPLAMHGTSTKRGGFPFSSSASLEGLDVLVVDDDPLTRTLMKRMLTRMGCSVSTAENGEIALEMILGAGSVTPGSSASGGTGPTLDQGAPSNPDGKYAIVFLDNQMPVLSGLKAVERLRHLGRRDFIVGVTGEHAWTPSRTLANSRLSRQRSAK
jgi:CheY-like chemotaxis protein